MKRIFIQLVLTMSVSCMKAQMLKSLVYDFDGEDIGQTDLPEGDYGSGDMHYEIAANPVAANDMVGDRVLKVNLNWSAGWGSFGRGESRYVELDPSQDRINFFIFNPSYNNQPAVIDLGIADDDDQSLSYNYASDDFWQKHLTINSTPGWQLVSVALSELTDSNPGGNSTFDIAFTQNKGMLLLVELRFSKPDPSAGNATFYVDFISFSEGILPRGNSELDLPYKSPSDYCLLGAYHLENIGQNDLIPVHVESQFPWTPGRKLHYANFFVQWAYDGSTTPAVMPDDELQRLLNAGYRPVLTWEPKFRGYGNLDPVQPRLSNILSGQYDGYFNSFAESMKRFTDTIIIRLMHEFEGDWYSWGITNNNQDPAQYVAAYRHIVDIFRAKGVTKVKWMWCVNSDYFPYRSYNWVVPAYPGDNYVDIVATDIYNNHYPITQPWWRSFRWQATESYYYLTKYFGNKPLYICEVGCRERFNGEPSGSQTKGEWFERMDKELQSNYHKARALLFFDAAPDQNWLISSSPGSIQSLTDNVWHDDYYFMVPAVGIEENEYGGGLYVYPNPNNGHLTVSYNSNTPKKDFSIVIMDASGKKVYSEALNMTGNSFNKQIDLTSFSKGIYLVELQATNHGESQDVIRQIRKMVLH
jgi:hypothetical protein